MFDLAERELTWKSKSGNVTHTAHTPQGFHIKMFLWFPPMENWQDWFKKGKEKCWTSVYPSIFAKLEPWQRMRSECNLEFKNSFSESTASTPGASSYRKTRKEALLRLDRDLTVLSLKSVCVGLCQNVFFCIHFWTFHWQNCIILQNGATFAPLEYFYIRYWARCYKSCSKIFSRLKIFGCSSVIGCRVDFLSSAELFSEIRFFSPTGVKSAAEII